MNSSTMTPTHRVIELACRAPSVHNTQPWRWRVVDDATIELYADRTRQLPVSDPQGRNLVLSCGAALHHCEVAARASGFIPVVELQPSAEDDSLLARIVLSPGSVTPESLESLQALEDRCTDRRHFSSWPVPESRLAHLAKAASGWGAHVFAITDVSDRFHTEKLLERARAVQDADPRFAEEQRAWVDHSRVDGVPTGNAVPPAPGRPPAPPGRFTPGAGDSPAAASAEPADADLVESSDGLMAICTAVDDQRSWLASGQALSALWLRATHDGLAIVPLSQVIEVDETRAGLRRDVFEGMAHPQILMRVGWAEVGGGRLPRTTRRPVADVVAS